MTIDQNTVKILSNQKTRKENQFQAVKGMHDIIPPDSQYWKTFIEQGFEVAEIYGFYYMETPIVEDTKLFERGVGAGTDIVEKEMFTFQTKGGANVALRPELTTGLMRSYLEHHLGHVASPFRVFRFGPIFRYERPQAGRYRQFHQWDFDIIGDGDVWYDVQIILTLISFLKKLGIKDVSLKINTVGCKVCRPTYEKKLTEYYKDKLAKMCEDCAVRHKKNPLRLLDCKEEECQKVRAGAPIILDYLSQNAKEHFKGTLELLEDNEISYELDPYLVRGLDYYNKTVFEIYGAGDKSAIAGGGRYDYLAEIIGGRVVPAVGGSFGMERVIEYIRKNNIPMKSKKNPSLSLIVIGDQAKKNGIRAAIDLREKGFRVLESVGKKSMSAQLKSADKAKTELAVIIGQREHFENTIIIRDMRTGTQETVPAHKAAETIRKILK